MHSRMHRRRALLFLLTVVVPCALLVGTTLRIISQERELADNRLAEAKRELAHQVKNELLTQLERIKLDAASRLAAAPRELARTDYQNLAVALVARVAGDRIVLPWEENLACQEFQRFLGEPEFRAAIEEGEREEFAGHAPERAAEQYRLALQKAQHPAQSAYAGLLLARALEESGHHREALAHARDILSLSLEIVDEHGIPLAHYAAFRLLQAGIETELVLVHLERAIDVERWLFPAEAYLVRDLLEQLGELAADRALRGRADQAQQKLRARIERIEIATELQRQFPGLMPMQAARGDPENAPTAWLSFADGAWLVSTTTPSESFNAVVAADAQEVLTHVESVARVSVAPGGRLRFSVDSRGQGEPMGPELPGLGVLIPADEEAALAAALSPQRYFYFGALLVVVGVTFFAAYLFWRDVRREVRLAEMRSRFVSSVSHELKTPLTSIRMFAETLRSGRTSDRDTRDEYLDTIVGESERLTRLLDNVLDFSKIERGQKVYGFQRASLPEVMRAAAAAVEYSLAQKGFRLHVDIDEDLPAIRVDPDAVEQVILNLLTNAMKYSGDERDIYLRLEGRDGEAVIEVADHGVGIPHEEQSLIFEEFYRASTPENQRIPGTGLGLTLAAHVAEAHGGRVSVISSPGQGSTFSLHLPLEPKQ